MSTARGVTFGQVTERSFARQHQDMQEKHSSRSGRNNQKHTGDTPPLTPATWRMQSRGMQDFDDEDEDEEDTPWRGTHDPLNHMVSDTEAATVQARIKSAKRRVAAQNRSISQNVNDKKAQMTIDHHHQVREWKHELQYKLKLKAKQQFRENRRAVVRHGKERSLNEAAVGESRENAQLLRVERASNWRDMRAKGADIVAQTEASRREYFQRLQRDNGIALLRRRRRA